MCRKIRYLIECFHAEFGFSYAIKCTINSRADLSIFHFGLVEAGNIRVNMLWSPKDRLFFFFFNNATYIAKVK